MHQILNSKNTSIKRIISIMVKASLDHNNSLEGSNNNHDSNVTMVQCTSYLTMRVVW